MMEKVPEGMRFIRYEIREGTTVAVFALDMPAPGWGWEGDEEPAGETVFDRASLEARLTNLRAAGAPAEVTAAALAAWPQAEDRHPGATGTPAGHQVPQQQKVGAVLRLFRGEDPERIARSLEVPVTTLMAWRDAFLAAGNSAL